MASKSQKHRMTAKEKSGVKTIFRGYHREYLKYAQQAKTEPEKRHWQSEAARIEQEILNL